MDWEIPAIVATVAVSIGALMGMGMYCEVLTKERVLRCQSVNVARPTVDVSVLCGTLR